jgi:hypothetical protein
MRERSFDPCSLKLSELGVAHLAGCHQELAMLSARHVPGDRNIKGLIGQYQPRDLITHQDLQHARIGGVATYEPMLS